MTESGRNMYIFLEFCDNKTLEHRMKGGVEQEKGLEYVKSIVDGCSYLYENDIFHRDLKPENILLHGDKIKITDFGFA